MSPASLVEGLGAGALAGVLEVVLASPARARRAGGLVRIAQRIPELPACWALFEQGRLGEEAMVLIARRVPAARDAEVAGWAAGMLISQLTRVLRSCPEVPDTDAPLKLHNGAVIPDVLARFLACDAEVLVATHAAGRLLGIHPTERTVNRHLRRVIERRDQGCTHPLCNQSRFLHIHHIEHWERGGQTIPANLLALCQRHHRQLHHGDFTIEGNPETHTLRFYDSRGAPIEPPKVGSPRPPQPPEPNAYTPPFGERLQARWFAWN